MKKRILSLILSAVLILSMFMLASCEKQKLSEMSDDELVEYLVQNIDGLYIRNGKIYYKQGDNEPSRIYEEPFSISKTSLRSDIAELEADPTHPIRGYKVRTDLDALYSDLRTVVVDYYKIKGVVTGDVYYYTKEPEDTTGKKLSELDGETLRVMFADVGGKDLIFLDDSTNLDNYMNKILAFESNPARTADLGYGLFIRTYLCEKIREMVIQYYDIEEYKGVVRLSALTSEQCANFFSGYKDDIASLSDGLDLNALVADIEADLDAPLPEKWTYLGELGENIHKMVTDYYNEYYYGFSRPFDDFVEFVVNES